MRNDYGGIPDLFRMSMPRFQLLLEWSFYCSVAVYDITLSIGQLPVFYFHFGLYSLSV